jgi:hypothetical protein
MITMQYGKLETRNTNRPANFTLTICLIYLALILVYSCAFRNNGHGVYVITIWSQHNSVFVIKDRDRYRSSRNPSATALAVIDYI